MAGITAYGAYVPLFRLGKQTEGWTAAVEKAIAGFDEDSLTMAVAAGINCLKGIDRQAVDGLFFASTTSPYTEKQASTTVATACDLREDILTADFTNSLRAGSIALRAALDAVKSGSARQILVTTAEMRPAQPRSEFESIFGDGAAAFLVGDSGVIAEVEDSYTFSRDITDVYRGESDPYVRSWEDRFVVTEGYLKQLPEAVSTLMAKKGLTPQDFARAVFYAPEGRRHREMARALGFDEKTQVQQGFFNVMGNTGAAFAPMLLCAALEQASAGERILLANYGNGADAFILTVTPEIEKAKDRRGVQFHLDSKRVLDNYQTYLRWRELLDLAPAARRPPLPVPSASAMYRELDQNIRLHGVKCRHCGTPQYPIQRVCTICRTKDDFEDYSFADKGATLFTYAMDYLGPTLDPPLVVSVIDFDGGGRLLCLMTDRDIDKISMGLPLEMTFRRLYVVEGIHNYYWKCMPIRG